MTEQHDETYDHHRGSQPLLRSVSRGRFWCFLGVNLLGFVAINAFWQYLCTGQRAGGVFFSYGQGLVTPVGQVLLEPLDVFSHPWMLLLVGLLLGVVVMTPLVISVLYRLRWGMLFAAVVAIVGHAPLLALAIVAGCMIAGRTSLRSDMPFLAVLAGLVVPALYLFLLGFVGVEDAAAVPSLQRWVLRVPFLIALVAAAAGAAVVLSLTRLARYRPGVVWPVLAAFLAGALLIFHLAIGPAELDYAAITSRLDGDDLIEPTSLEAWQSRLGAAGLTGQSLLARVGEDLKDRRRGLEDLCAAYLARYPASRQSPSVQWILAREQCLQHDVQAFADGQVSFMSWRPLESSAEAWRKLRQAYPVSPQAALAALRLAQLALRQADVRQADELLRQAGERLREMFPRDSDLQVVEKVPEMFSEPVVLPSRAHYAQAMMETQELAWLIEQNKLMTNKRSAQAMAEYLSLNRPAMTDAEYLRRLVELAGKYEDTELSENLKLAVAKENPDVQERLHQLQALAAQHGDADAAIEANYVLAQLLVQDPSLQHRGDMETPEAYFRHVIEAPPSPWRHRAAEYLNWLQVATRPKQTASRTEP